MGVTWPGRVKGILFPLRQGDGGKAVRTLSERRSAANLEETGPKGDAPQRRTVPESVYYLMYLISEEREP